MSPLRWSDEFFVSLYVLTDGMEVCSNYSSIRKRVLCLSDEDCPEEGLTVLHAGLHEFAFSFNLPQMWVHLLKFCTHFVVLSSSSLCSTQFLWQLKLTSSCRVFYSKGLGANTHQCHSSGRKQAFIHWNSADFSGNSVKMFATSGWKLKTKSSQIICNFRKEAKMVEKSNI